MSADATAMYVVYDSAFQRACGVYRIDAKGQRRITTANPCPDSLAHDDEHVYAAGLESVWRVPVRGGQREVVAAFGGGASSLVARDTVLMWASLADDAIMLAPKRGGELRALMPMEVEVLAIDERWLYAVDDRGDALWRLDPLEGTQENLGSVFGCTRALAVDDEFVYGATRCARTNADDADLDTIWRMRKEGSSVKSLANVPTPESLAVTNDTIYTTTRDANDCTRLERYAKRVGNPVLGICDPGRWSLRRITSR
jgi:hypothetical protein